MNAKSLIKPPHVENYILLIRGEKVIIDADLASFYGVTTKRLNEQVKRNKSRFPSDFLFQLSQEEKSEVVATCDHLNSLKFSKSLPYAFTEYGAIMASSILKSPRAIQVGIFIARAFVRMRKAIEEHRELSEKISQLEQKMIEHDDQLIQIVQIIKQLLNPNLPERKYRIGFQSENDSDD